MKAEHRKELETNVLADRLGQIVQGVKQKPTQKSVFVWLIVVVAAALIGVWWYLARTTSATQGALWVRLDLATSAPDLRDTLKELQQIEDQNPGTTPARTAGFQRARILLFQGLQQLGSETRRADSIDSIETARTLYGQLAGECSDVPLLQQEALMGQAKAEEALIGIPKADKSNEFRGSLDQALKYYDDLAAVEPKTFQTQAAEKRAKELRDQAAQIRGFYGELAKRYPSK